MKYRILAHSKDTGQRMTLELDAQSKADAERKATCQNLNIIRIEPAEAPLAEPKEWTPVTPKRSFKLPWLLILLALLAGALYYFWPAIQSMIPNIQIHTSRPTTTTPSAE